MTCFESDYLYELGDIVISEDKKEIWKNLVDKSCDNELEYGIVCGIADSLIFLNQGYDFEKVMVNLQNSNVYSGIQVRAIQTAVLKLYDNPLTLERKKHL